ncbi:MAG: hypothetical protein J6D54_13540, partial [Olsenella sp.]|nr:hypothetical protein [Olsenella sp.]
MDDTRDGPQPILRTAAYTAAQVADLMGYDVHAIYRATKDEDHRLRSFVPNGNSKGMRILGEWVIEWLESGAQGGNQRAPQEQRAAKAAQEGA